jgi:hypothetical protein
VTEVDIQTYNPIILCFSFHPLAPTSAKSGEFPRGHEKAGIQYLCHAGLDSVLLRVSGIQNKL